MKNLCHTQSFLSYLHSINWKDQNSWKIPPLSDYKFLIIFFYWFYHSILLHYILFYIQWFFPLGYSHLVLWESMLIVVQCSHSWIQSFWTWAVTKLLNAYPTWLKTQILPLCPEIDISKYFESMFLSELQSITTFYIRYWKKVEKVTFKLWEKQC